MNADFLAVLEFWDREKGISRDVLVAAVNEALLAAAKKAVLGEPDKKWDFSEAADLLRAEATRGNSAGQARGYLALTRRGQGDFLRVLPERARPKEFCYAPSILYSGGVRGCTRRESTREYTQ